MSRVLVIEDSDLALGLRANLELEGYEVEVARDGRRGLELLRASAPDLVVLDLMLPELDGLRVLRNRGMNVHSVPLHVAGVDDTWSGRADVARALAGRRDGIPTLLLAHDPNLFAVAASHRVEPTLSGHTHGGQLAVPGYGRKWTLARLITEYTAGLFRVGESQLYVSRGAGTTGPPVRLGAPAEQHDRFGALRLFSCRD